MSEVHLRITPGVYACGVGHRWGSQQVTSTEHKLAVTCEGCKNTAYFASTRQHIPSIPVPVYRHAK